jgi:outer membrane receptor protein involved in Fe transport
LERREPASYERTLRGPDAPADATTRVRVTQLGFYLQDQWTPNPRLTVTGGVRVDVPLLSDQPRENPDLLAELGISSATTPSGGLLWTPRLGVNYDLSARGTAFVRGGIGLFSGRPAYSWLRNAYSDLGRVGFTNLFCEGGQVPAFTLDPSNQPSTCADASIPRPLITVFDPRFRFPRDLKLSLGADVTLPWDMVATTDLLFTAGIDQFAQRDLNLGLPVGVATGEGDRPLYGGFDSEGGPTPNHLSSAFDAVTQMTNESGNRAYTIALQVRKRLGGVGEVLAAYSYTDARDRTDLPGLSGRGNLGLSVLDGTWEQPRLSTALWSRPHKVTLFATARLPLGMRLGLSYVGVSGTPFTYIVDGDANFDGFDNLDQGRHNDAVYVPRNADDITLEEGQSFEDLDRYIESEPCLRSQRGRLLRRNSCRNPWSGRLDLRLTEALPTARGQSLELVADLFNVLNLLDNDWGRVRSTVEDFGGVGTGNRVALLRLNGYDTDRGRGVYQVRLPVRREVDVNATRWRIRLSLRYLL